jgi:small-conductance mechanosensitive channel
VTLVVAYLVSSLIRFVLAEEVYPRAGIPTGTSYAASSVFHYAIMTLAFLLALGLLGVTLTQVTVLAGALGVGIGFGLQGVVNNFVSGLILLFERPINVGDAVQVGDLQGWVRRIGIRASVVRTFQGAEIIVPNAQLTTQQVTNWTLSDQQRRIDLPVGLSYGVEPAKVIELLEDVATAHPRVLRDPSPRCLFMGYGDSSINFELRAWTDYAIWIQVQSDLTVAVYEAVYAAGMTFPFPQREVRLLGERTTVSRVPAGTEESPE